VEEVPAGLDDAESQWELRGALGGVRRALVDLQSRQLPDLDAGRRRVLEEVSEVVRAGVDLRTGLELTAPLIPLLLEYESDLDLGGGLDLRQWWENMRAECPNPTRNPAIEQPPKSQDNTPTQCALC
jgi:hypothetical protein